MCGLLVASIGPAPTAYSLPVCEFDARKRRRISSQSAGVVSRAGLANTVQNLRIEFFRPGNRPVGLDQVSEVLFHGCISPLRRTGAGHDLEVVA